MRMDITNRRTPSYIKGTGEILKNQPSCYPRMPMSEVQLASLLFIGGAQGVINQGVYVTLLSFSALGSLDPLLDRARCAI